LYRDINIHIYSYSSSLLNINIYTYQHTIQIQHISTFRFDDGDVIDNLEDAYIFNKEDYLLTIRLEKSKKKKEWIGVRNVVDEKSSDMWARSVGWYVANIDGEERPFSLLSDALRAYDAHVIQSSHLLHRVDKKYSQLNLPEEWEDTLEG